MLGPAPIFQSIADIMYLYILYMFQGAATLTTEPYGSAGTCIINYAPPQINVVVMAKALFVFHNVNITSQSTLNHNRQHDSDTGTS